MNNYLTCEHCGYLNEASSEYLVFCGSCKRKLVNNFREWRKTHPERGLHEFHQEMCENQEDLRKYENSNESGKSAEKKKKATRVAILAALSFIALLSVFYSIYSFSFTLSDDNWTKELYGDYGLVVETPLKLEPVSAPVSIANASLIQDIQAFSSNPSSDFLLIAISTNFRPEANQVELQAGISNFIHLTANAPGISDFKVSQKETEISGNKGFEQRGSFIKNGEAKEFLGLGITKGHLLWQIMTVYNKGDEVLKKQAERIIKSVEINYNTVS